MLMNAREQSLDRGYIIYDRDVVQSGEDISFDPKQLADVGSVVGKVQGRGVTYFIKLKGQDCVLRHYYRGGAIARVIRDKYFWTGIRRTRAWREWCMLEKLCEMGLPVPRPVAARVLRRGPFYTADIIIERLIGACSLTELLRQHKLGEDLWRSIGTCIRRFHDAGVYHADLNAHNILLKGKDAIYVVDFDRSKLCNQSDRWRLRNLTRLYRSLIKLRKYTDAYYFSDRDWQALCEGYG